MSLRRADANSERPDADEASASVKLPPRRYTALYHDDPDLAAVDADDALLAAWTRLRLLADAAWPSAAAVPRRCSDEVLTKLVNIGLVAMQPGDHYRMPALDAERKSKVEQASSAGKASARGARRGPTGAFAKRRAPTTPQRPMVRPPTGLGRSTNEGPTTSRQHPNQPAQRAGVEPTSPFASSAGAGDAPALGEPESVDERLSRLAEDEYRILDDASVLEAVKEAARSNLQRLGFPTERRA